MVLASNFYLFKRSKKYFMRKHFADQDQLWTTSSNLKSSNNVKRFLNQYRARINSVKIIFFYLILAGTLNVRHSLLVEALYPNNQFSQSNNTFSQ